MIELFQDFYRFMAVHRKFWMLPILLALVLLGSLIVFSQGSVAAPFIYTLF